ncbi:hypothetical protein [Rhodococcus spongiicola]|uniref:Uncharacterized protein n=1 Tax=Rhodococcus spongiicola TaxID=2487352 RepID=A0A3S3ZK03_9NOCA|nr:hypothetical protein [Rhodococcus spongiicola]RVW02498.1 hypothetical protein EF834_13115 [Rhodococcus spongiicola]
MSDLIHDFGVADRGQRLRRGLQRQKDPLLLMSLSVIPGLITFRVYESIALVVVITVFTAISIAAAAVLFRPR